MITATSFDQLYEQKLKPGLESLEQSRKTVVTVFWSGIGLLLASVPCILFAIAIGQPIALLLISVPVIFAIFKFIDYGKKKKSYTASFKEEIIGTMIRSLDASLLYTPQNCIPEQDYVAAGIFRARIDSYSGDDLVTGRLGATKITFSELHHQEKQESTDSKGQRHENWVTIFKGIFFIADFNKNFNGITYIMPDAGNSFLGIGKLFEKWTIGRGQLVNLENPAFEKLFTVYSSDQVEARYILSTSMMERLVAFRKKAANTVHLSFVHSKVHIAISINKSLFEPNVFSTGLQPDYLKEYFSYLQLTTGIVDDLNLNLRIWGKN